jgi:hypothetical protein
LQNLKRLGPNFKLKGISKFTQTPIQTLPR